MNTKEQKLRHIIREELKLQLNEYSREEIDIKDLPEGYNFTPFFGQPVKAFTVGNTDFAVIHKVSTIQPKILKSIIKDKNFKFMYPWSKNEMVFVF